MVLPPPTGAYTAAAAPHPAIAAAAAATIAAAATRWVRGRWRVITSGGATRGEGLQAIDPTAVRIEPFAEAAHQAHLARVRVYS